jgi:acetolactate synthase-1/2/3 large subunit
MAPTMKASDYVIEFLQAQGVHCIFEVAGGMITHIIDSAYKKNLHLVSMHFEQAAAFAADGMARISGIPAVAMATSGPGATNMLTGIGSCYFDSVPALFLLGQVNRSEQKGSRPIRQLGFQETDIVSMAAPITKGAFRVKSPEELPNLLESAFMLSRSGRPGPVVLDIPFDVQRAEIAASPAERVANRVTGEFRPDSIRDLILALRSAHRPLILAGGGLWSSRTAEMFRRLIDTIQVPVVCSLMALDVLPYDHPNGWDSSAAMATGGRTSS